MSTNSETSADQTDAEIAAESVEQQSVEPRDRLAATVNTNIGKDLASDANDRKASLERLINGQKTFLKNLRATVTVNMQQADRIEQEIGSVLSGMDQEEQTKNVTHIIARLTDDIPDYGENASQGYLYSKNMTSTDTRDFVTDDVVIYMGNAQKLTDDLQYAKGLAARVPANQKQPFLDLQRMIEGYANHTVPQMQAYERGSKPHFQDKVINKFGMTIGLIGAVTLAVLTGIPMLTSRKMKIAPVLFAGMAVFIASPSLRRALFGNENENALAEMDKKLHNPDLRQITQNDMKPSTVTKIVEHMHRNPDTQQFDLNIATEEEKLAFAESVYPQEQDPEGHDQFVSLIEKKPASASALISIAKTQDKAVWDVCHEYIRLDCRQYERDMNKVQSKMIEKEEKAQLA